MAKTDDILTILLGGYEESRRAARRQILGGRPIPLKTIRDHMDTQDGTLRTTLWRLKRNGLVDRSDDGWVITRKGVEFFRKVMDGNKRMSRLIHGKYGVEMRNRVKNMVVIFDIPEKRRGWRNWLRTELVGLGFVKLQQSVWFGPAPLPKDFIKTLSKFDILRFIKFFKATEFEII
jgi:DNA-binding transcriptional regulator PaaX